MVIPLQQSELEILYLKIKKSIEKFYTFLFEFLIQFLIYGGILLLLFGGIIPFGKIIVFMSNVIIDIVICIQW